MDGEKNLKEEDEMMMTTLPLNAEPRTSQY